MSPTVGCWAPQASEYWRMDFRKELFARHHGLVRTRELLAIGEDTEMIRWMRNYRTIVSVRQGWWALPGTPAVLLRAWGAGGRLACVSALAFHGEILDVSAALHIEIAGAGHAVHANGAVVHWSRDQGNGDRRAVSVEVAWMQANRCAVANGSL